MNRVNARLRNVERDGAEPRAVSRSVAEIGEVRKCARKIIVDEITLVQNPVAAPRCKRYYARDVEIGGVAWSGPHRVLKKSA